MNRHYIHMRDQKASLVVMERYRRQQAFQERLEQFVTFASIGVFALIAALS